MSTALDTPDWGGPVISGLSAPVTGTLTNVNDTVTLPVIGGGVAVALFTGGSFAGEDVIIAEVSIDGSNWAQAPVEAFLFASLGGTGDWYPTLFGPGAPLSVGAVSHFLIPVAAMLQVRLRKIATGGGGVTAMLRVGPGTLAVGPLQPTSFKDPGAATIANGAFMTIWTPTSGYRWNLQLLVVSADATGELILKESTTERMTLNVVARQTLVVPFPGNGMPANGTNADLRLYNNTGGAAGLHGNAAGFETT